MNGVEQDTDRRRRRRHGDPLPALGELIGERAGVVNLGTEGACSPAPSAGSRRRHDRVARGSASLGGIAAGALFGLAHAWLVVMPRRRPARERPAVWFLALGVTSVFGTELRRSADRAAAERRHPRPGRIPWLGPILFDQDVLVYAGTSWSR